MSATETYTKICKLSNDKLKIRSINEGKQNTTIVKYEEKKLIICDKCTLLNSLKNTVTNIYNSSLKNESKDKKGPNFCDLDIINNFSNALQPNKSCDNCRLLKSETSVQSAHRRKKHKHTINRTGSQIDNRSKNSLNASSIEQKASRKTRSLSRNKHSDEDILDKSKEEVLKWKNEIETLDIKRQVFTAVGQHNTPRDLKSSKDKDKYTAKQPKKKHEIIDFNFGDNTDDKKTILNDDGPKLKNNFPRKELDELDNLIKNTHRSSKKKRNNSPNLPLVQNNLEIDKNLKGGKKSPVPDVLINAKNSDFKEKDPLKLLKGEDKGKDKTIRSLSKSKNPKVNEDISVENISDKVNIIEDKDNYTCAKEIIDVFKKTYDNEKIPNDNSGTVKSKHKRKHKDEHKTRKHKMNDQTEEDKNIICPRHSNLKQQTEDRIELGKEINKENNITKAPLLFGIDYLMNSEAMHKDNESNKKHNKEIRNSTIANNNHEDFQIKDRKEISFSNLNLSPIIDHYATNKSIIDSIFDNSKKKTHTKDARTRLSEEFSIISEAVTSKERTIRRQRPDRAKRYFGSQAKTTRLINQTRNHLVSDENLIEVSTKIIANDLIKSSVEGIEPPRKIVNNTFHRRTKTTTPKNDSMLHMTFLEPVNFPDLSESFLALQLSSTENDLKDNSKTDVPLTLKKEVSQIKASSLKLRSSTERKSKISVLYEHRSNSARRKELRNKICKHGSKSSIVNNKSIAEGKENVQKTCTNPDLTRRVFFARNSNKLPKCSKCHGTKKIATSIKSTIVSFNKIQEMPATMFDKSISVNITDEANANPPLKKDKKLTKKMSSKRMCTVDTQTDLIDYKNFTKTADDVSQTPKINNVSKLCSPIVIAIPGIHKSDTNVVQNEDKPEKSRDLKPSAYQKLQSAVLSLFENAKTSYEEEIEELTKTKKDVPSKKSTNFAADVKKIVKTKPVTPPVRPISPIKPVLTQQLSPIKPILTNTLRPTKVDVYSARTRLPDRSGIPKPFRKSQEEPQESKAKDCKLCKVKKLDECKTFTPVSSASKLVDLKSLQGCIEDLISVLNDMKIRQPEIKQRIDDVIQTNSVVKHKDLNSCDKNEAEIVLKTELSVDYIEQEKISRKIKRRSTLNKFQSSAMSFDSNRNSSDVGLNHKTRSKQSRKSSRKKLRKPNYPGVGEEKKLHRVFKNRNCYGSSSCTQVSSSESDLINAINENDLNSFESPNVCDSYFLHNDNQKTNLKSEVGVDNSSTVLMEQTTNVQNKEKNNLKTIDPDLLRKSLFGDLPKQEQTIQKPSPTPEDYKNIMEQLVYMFSQKPLPKTEELGQNKASATSSSNFSADSIEQSYKCEVPNRTAPPKNCDFFVYATTIELDDKGMKKDLKEKDEENTSTKTFTSFKNQNKLKSNASINNTSSRSTYNVASHDSGFGTPAGKKSASLKNFFKKGGSLLDLFKNKRATNSMDISNNSTSKCEPVSETSSLNKTETLGQHNEVIVGFAPTQFMFSLCPQKKNSLETVHEGVQATPATAETSTMRKWTDFAINESNQTPTLNESNPRPADRIVDSKNMMSSCTCPVKASGKHHKPCRCKATQLKPIDPASLDVANFILNALLDNVMERTAEHPEPILDNTLGSDNNLNNIASKEEEDNISKAFHNAEAEFSENYDALAEDYDGLAEDYDGLVEDYDGLVEDYDGLYENDDESAEHEPVEENLIPSSKPSENDSNVVDDGFETLLKSEEPPTIDDIDRLLLDDVQTVDSDEAAQEYNRRNKSKSKSVDISAGQKIEQPPSVEDNDTLMSTATNAPTIEDDQDESTPRLRSNSKSKSVDMSAVKQPALKVTDDSLMKTNITIVASSLSNKEMFEKMLNAYEKEDSVAERLSMDDEFFEKEVDNFKSNSKVELSSPEPSDDDIFEQATDHHALATDSEMNSDHKKKGKRNKLRLMFGRHKENVKQLMAPTEEERAIIQRHDSIKQLITSDTAHKQTGPTDSSQRGSASKSKDMRFSGEAHKPSTSVSKKKADCAPVEADDIGTCFARGFRPDNLALSGDACFNFNKQDKYVLSPNMANTEASIIDFSERQTPLDYLLALGFMVDEASNALKDEDIRSRLLAAITEARVWINKITTTQGTLLYLVSYKTHPKTMRYFLQLVEAIINNRINNAIKLNGFLKVLERVEDGELQMINLLGADKFEDEENEEKIVKKQLRQLFATVYKIAEKEAKMSKNALTKESLILLRVLAAKYRTGLHPHLELIASYIGQNLIKNEIQLEAAMIYLSRLDTADVKLKEFEAYCAIRCDEENVKKPPPSHSNF